MTCRNACAAELCHLPALPRCPLTTRCNACTAELRHEPGTEDDKPCFGPIAERDETKSSARSLQAVPTTPLTQKPHVNLQNLSALAREVPQPQQHYAMIRRLAETPAPPNYVIDRDFPQ